MWNLRTAPSPRGSAHETMRVTLRRADDALPSAAAQADNSDAERLSSGSKSGCCRLPVDFRQNSKHDSHADKNVGCYLRPLSC
jgi:hypothetical protein